MLGTKKGLGFVLVALLAVMGVLSLVGKAEAATGYINIDVTSYYTIGGFPVSSRYMSVNQSLTYTATSPSTGTFTGYVYLGAIQKDCSGTYEIDAPNGIINLYGTYDGFTFGASVQGGGLTGCTDQGDEGGGYLEGSATFQAY